MVVTAEQKAQVFRLRAPLLSKGRHDTELGRTDLLALRLKVYAEGGENALHAHTNEYHTFIILQGQATFHDREDNETVLTTNEGILVPKGTYYRFQSSGDVNLVMVRVGAGRAEDVDDRINPEGRPLPGESAENLHVEGVPIPGRFFGG